MLASLGLIWAIFQMLAYLHFGLIKSVDTNMYILDAQNILDGNWPGGRGFWYSGYSLLMAVVLTLGFKPTAIIIFHLIASLLAVLSIYKLIQKITQQNLTAFLGAILYLLWFKFHQWNFIVYTDSLFTSMSVISITLIYYLPHKSQRILLLPVIAFTVLLRPAGIGFLIATVSYFIYNASSANGTFKRYRISILVLVTILGINLMNFILNNFIDSFLASYAKAEIIYPNISLFVVVPSDLVLPSSELSPLMRLAMFAFFNPIYFLKITILKALLFLGHAKPYYSLSHNVFIIGFLVPTYFFAIKGFKNLPLANIKVFCLIFIVFQILTVSLTSENWDGRFLLPVLPFVFILSAIGLSAFLKKELLSKNE